MNRDLVHLIWKQKNLTSFFLISLFNLKKLLFVPLNIILVKWIPKIYQIMDFLQTNLHFRCIVCFIKCIVLHFKFFVILFVLIMTISTLLVNKIKLEKENSYKLLNYKKFKNKFI